MCPYCRTEQRSNKRGRLPSVRTRHSRGRQRGNCVVLPPFFFGFLRLSFVATTQVWPTQHLRLAKLRQDNPLVAEAPIGIGVLGQQNWFIPLWTAKRNSSFAHYTGLAGEHNRDILADTFKRPTTWGDYCDEVSNSSCTEPDEFATRPPAGSDEAQMYHHGWDTFKGYFRKTEENNCEDFPDTCTGHFAE